MKNGTETRSGKRDSAGPSHSEGPRLGLPPMLLGIVLVLLLPLLPASAAVTGTITFSPTPVQKNLTTLMTITITNTGGAISDLSFGDYTDFYPTDLQNATPWDTAEEATSCGGGVEHWGVGSDYIGLSGGALAAGSSCHVTVWVKDVGLTQTLTYTISTLSWNGGVAPSFSGSAKFVLPSPSVSANLNPSTIAKAGISTLTYTITNNDLEIQNGTPENITGLTFTETYPAAITTAPTPNASTNCGFATVATTSGSLTLSGATVPQGTRSTSVKGSCWVKVDITTAYDGQHSLTTSAVTSDNAFPGALIGQTLSVYYTPPTTVKSFSPSEVSVGANVNMTIRITNQSWNPAIHGLAFSDSYPGTFVNSRAAPVSNNCGGSVTMTTGGSSFGLSGGTLPQAGYCQVMIQVKSSTKGTFTNTISDFNSV